MINGVVFLASYAGFGGGAIGDLFAQWEAAGIFSYALPFLLLFGLIFAILSFVPIFQQNKAINAVIALATALMALQFNMVSIFFSEIFPRMGIALSIVLVVIILMGLFIDKDNHGLKWMLIILVLIVTIVVVSSSLKAFGVGMTTGYWLRNNWQTLLGVGIVVAFVIAIIASGSKREIPKVEIPFLGR